MSIYRPIVALYDWLDRKSEYVSSRWLVLVLSVLVAGIATFRKIYDPLSDLTIALTIAFSMLYIWYAFFGFYAYVRQRDEIDEVLNKLKGK